MAAKSERARLAREAALPGSSGTGPARMTGANERSETGAVGLLRYGVEFIAIGHDALDGFRKREAASRGPGRRHVPPSQSVPFPVYFNFLHGVELGLKSWLLHAAGVPVESLKSDFGHHLDALVEAAVDHGLRRGCPSLTNTHIAVVELSSPTYVSKEFEYHRVGGCRLAPIDAVADAADALIADLGVLLVGARRLELLAPGASWLKRALARRPQAVEAGRDKQAAEMS